MGLYIPIRTIVYASGIDEKQIIKDIKDGVLQSNNGLVWYRTAAQYVYEKWNNGKTLMYAPYSDDMDHSFAMRVLSLMDDEISTGTLTVKWKDQK